MRKISEEKERKRKAKVRLGVPPGWHFESSSKKIVGLG
jgi:hypothetical protein